MKKSNFLTALFLLLSPVTQAQTPDTPVALSNIAQLQVLNKTTAKTSVVEIKTGSELEFGSIIIGVRKCWQAPLDQKPESKILIEVFETAASDKNDETSQPQKTKIFYGWLFASSPSVSGVEHPIYDIVAVGCKNK